MADLPTPPKIPTGKEMYDWIMGQIEPELVSDNLPSLKEKYKDETPDERAARATRYQEAYEQYDNVYAGQMGELKRRVREYQRAAMASVEEEVRVKEEAELADLESTISSL